jgi:transposase InsO family protein
MPWKEVEPMDERVKFVAAYREGLFTLVELCERFGVSRKTGYKWLGRYEAHGAAGLAERSSAPHTCPRTTPEAVRQAVIAQRRAHPSWGPRKLLVRLAQEQPQLVSQAGKLPVASTVGQILKAAGLVQAHKRRARPVHPGSGPLVAEQPNDVWCADFKGEFRTGDGGWCYPLTVSDACSRYLLACRGLPSTQHAGAQEAMERLFAEVGLPEAIRTDNGCPFCSQAILGLSRLSVWWMKLGIAHQRIRPGKPQDNPRHERMHRTLKAQTTRPPAANAQGQQARFDGFQHEYNHERPHESLAMRTPASVWTPSRRPLPATLPTPEYAAHMQVRVVHSGGTIKLRGKVVFVSEVLEGVKLRPL